MGKDQFTIIREFYSEMKSEGLDLPVTMNRQTAGYFLSSNPYWEDIPADLKSRLSGIVNSKTNWGRNVLMEELRVNLLEWMLML